MTDLKCNLNIPEVSGLKKDIITVGRILELNCTPSDGAGSEGTNNTSNVNLAISEFNELTAKFKTADPNENSYKLLKVKKQDNGLQFTWTVYRTGSVKIPQLIVTDGTQELSLGPQDLTVASVIEKTQEPPKPFGPLFPLSLPIPISYVFLAASVVVVVFAALGRFIYSKYQIKKIKGSLKQYDSSVEPDLQFYRSLRGAEHKKDPLLELEHSFYVYLSRRCYMPLLSMGRNEAFRFHKQAYPDLKKLRKQIQKILEEIDHVRLDTQTLAEQKMNSILPKLFRFIDEVEAKINRVIL